jgi:hypothetical protein
MCALAYVAAALLAPGRPYAKVNWLFGMLTSLIFRRPGYPPGRRLLLRAVVSVPQSIEQRPRRPPRWRKEPRTHLSTQSFAAP